MIQKIQPPDWAEPKGYANGVVAHGRMLFIAGMVGWDANGVFASDDFATQAKVALEKESSGDTFYVAKLATARFYFAKLFPETAMLMRTARSGAKVLMDTQEALA